MPGSFCPIATTATVPCLRTPASAPAISWPVTTPMVTTAPQPVATPQHVERQVVVDLDGLRLVGHQVVGERAQPLHGADASTGRRV